MFVRPDQWRPPWLAGRTPRLGQIFAKIHPQSSAARKAPKVPEPGARDTDQIKLTDEQSRLMPVHGGGFEQALQRAGGGGRANDAGGGHWPDEGDGFLLLKQDSLLGKTPYFYSAVTLDMLISPKIY